ncbi:MAG TPA: hypothetical protein VN229_23780 [Terriglobales bacterium]|nr:hypothetical protein [Terriglobales bacterium]
MVIGTLSCPVGIGDEVGRHDVSGEDIEAGVIGATDKYPLKIVSPGMTGPAFCGGPCRVPPVHHPGGNGYRIAAPVGNDRRLRHRAARKSFPGAASASPVMRCAPAAKPAKLLASAGPDMGWFM